MQFPNVGLPSFLLFFIVPHQGGDIKNIGLEKHEADEAVRQFTSQILFLTRSETWLFPPLHNSPQLRAAALRPSGPSGSLLHIYLSPILLKNLHLRDPRLTKECEVSHAVR